MAVEQIRKNEQELKELMIWSGRAGLWDDWVKFQAQARVQRKGKRLKLKRLELSFIIILAKQQSLLRSFSEYLA
jgi:hypothetical protein